MSNIKPVTLYGHASPNPWKVAITLEELSIPYSIVHVSLHDAKSSHFVSINPNGRLPAIEDLNTGIVLWESGAITEYLVEQYDRDEILTYKTVPEKYLLKQWLYFQMSGQGPYFGQAAWFAYAHSERLPSAIERYQKEVERVIGVLDVALEGRDWLVGDKCMFADLAFLGWDTFLPFVLQKPENEFLDRYTNYGRWVRAMMARAAVKKVLVDEREKLWHVA